MRLIIDEEHLLEKFEEVFVIGRTFPNTTPAIQSRNALMSLLGSNKIRVVHSTVVGLTESLWVQG